MRKLLASGQRSIALAVIASVAVPMTLTGYVRSQDESGRYFEPLINIRYAAEQDRERLQQGRREFYRAMDVYSRLVHEGYTELILPDVNVPWTYDQYLDRAYLQELEEGSLHASAPEDIGALTYDELPEWERDFIDGYKRIGFCPTLLQQYHIEGFYDLCLGLLIEKENQQSAFYESATRLRGFVRTQPPGYQSLKERLRVLDETLNALSDDAATNRPRTYEGGRPRPRINTILE